MQLTVDLATAHAAPCFCPEARVTNILPAETVASRVQRSGWIEGHLRTIFAQVPRLLGWALRRGRLDLALLAIELSLPPLSILILVWAVVSIFAMGVSLVHGISWPFWIVVYDSAALLVAGTLFWATFGRKRVPVNALLAMPLLFKQSIAAALAAAFTRPKPWIRISR